MLRFPSPRLLCLLLMHLLPATMVQAQFMNGVDANYALELEKQRKPWSVGGKAKDIFDLLAEAGADSFRVRLWTGDDGMNGLHYATETALRAQKAGLKPYVVLFLSDSWSDLMKQPAPAMWKDLTGEAKLAAIEAYAQRVTRHLADKGVQVELFEIGNEIDFGICGVFEEEWPKRVSIEYMQQRIWSQMAPIVAAVQKGVKKAQPNAKFILHLAQWNKADYCIAFWKSMQASGVAVDYPGLSYFPTSAKAEESSLAFFTKQLTALHDALNRPVIICEYAYPSEAAFPGQFADWNKPVAGYPLDLSGQAKWLADFQSALRAAPHVAGAYYWSPEWYLSDADMWRAFALFDQQGQAKPALAALKAPLPAPATLPATQSAAAKVYFGNLHSHTAYSDGSGTPDDAFAYARDVAKLDFLAITEHNHLLGGDKATPAERRSLYSGPPDTALVPAAARHMRDGKFVAFYGQEFSSMSKGNHVNVFDAPAVIDIANGDFAGLLGWMDRNRDSTGQTPILQFNHPALGPPNKKIGKNEYGRDDFKDDAGWISKIGSVTHLIEIVNGDPLPGVLGKRASQMMEEHFQLYLQLGFRLAPVGDQDNHKRDWGTLTDVRTAIIAPELTKKSLLAAMRARHVYATEDHNLKLIIRAAGQLCGDVLTEPQPDLKVTYHIDDADEPQAAYTIDVFSGVIGEKPATVVKTVNAVGNTVEGAIDGLRLDQDGQYVYFRVTQKGDGPSDRAWTAPVWLELPK